MKPKTKVAKPMASRPKRKPVDDFLKLARKFKRDAGINGVRVSVVRQSDGTHSYRLSGLPGSCELAKYAIESGFASQ